MLESVDQNKLWRYKQRYHDISKSQIDQQIVYRCPRNKSVFLSYFKVSSSYLSLNFTCHKLYFQIQTDIETILQLVLTVLRTNASFTILVYIRSFRGDFLIKINV